MHESWHLVCGWFRATVGRSGFSGEDSVGPRRCLLLAIAWLATIPFALSSCGGGGGGGGGTSAPPLIFAELDSFATGSIPAGLTKTAFVAVLDDESGASITNASVMMNGVTLAYSTANEDYEGLVVVPPGGSVNLSV